MLLCMFRWELSEDSSLTGVVYESDTCKTLHRGVSPVKAEEQVFSYEYSRVNDTDLPLSACMPVASCNQNIRVNPAPAFRSINRD